MLRQHSELGKLAQFRKFKIKAGHFILRALGKGRTAQWGCYIEAILWKRVVEIGHEILYSGEYNLVFSHSELD